jgi:hypothetical protein
LTCCALRVPFSPTRPQSDGQPAGPHPNPNPQRQLINDRGNWLADEEFHLAMCHMLVGNQWSQHCNRLRGRTENSIKNFWNATLRSKQANKRRGFLWAYIEKVRNALDDDSLRYQAFADTVRGWGWGLRSRRSGLY